MIISPPKSLHRFKSFVLLKLHRKRLLIIYIVHIAYAAVMWWKNERLGPEDTQGKLINWPIGKPAPLSYCCSLGQTNGVAHCLTMTDAVWKPCPTMFLHNFGHSRPPNVNKCSMEGFIKYLKINTVGNSKRGFTDLNASRRSLILRSSSWSWMTTCRINTVHVSQGMIKLMYI